MSREGKLAKNTLVLSVGTFLPHIVTFITLPILTGCLTKAEMGAYDLVTVMVSLLLPAATMQIQMAAFRFLVDIRDNETEIKKIVTNIIVFTIPISVVVLIITFFCLSSQRFSVRLWICLYFFADIIVNTGRQICRGLGNNKDYSISAIISSVGKMIIILLCVFFLGWGLTGTLVSLFASCLFSCVYLLVKTRLYRYFDIHYLSKTALLEMLHYTWPLVPNGMSAWVMRLSDRLVVTAVMGISTNAVYAVANKIPSLLQIAQHTFMMAWQENATIFSKDEDASEYYSKMLRVIFDLMAGFFGLLIAATPLLFRLLIRGDYGEAYYQMPLLFFGMFFLGISTFLGGIYVAFKRSKSVGITTTVAAVINLVTDIATIKWIGLFAASGSTLIAYLFLCVYRIIDVQKIIKVKVNILHSIPVLLIMVVESILCYLQRPYLDMVNIVLGILLFFVLNKALIIRLKTKIETIIRNRKSGSEHKEDSHIIELSQSGIGPMEKSTQSKPLPELSALKQNCCGCSACFAVCPVCAISMKQDEEGFLYPVVDAEKCIGCYRCISVCAFKVDQTHKGNKD